MEAIINFILGITLLSSAFYDIRFQRIPNWLTLTAVIFGLFFNEMISGLDGISNSIGGILLGIAIFIIPYALGGMGAGDAKLMGAVGSFLGVKGVLIAALLTMVVGGIYAILLMLWHWRIGKQILIQFKDYVLSVFLTKRLLTFSVTHPTSENKPKLCYGVAIAGGTFIYMILESRGIHFPMM